MAKQKKIKLGTYTPPDPALVSEEDIRWVEIVRRSVDGLAAFAEAQGESCDSAWMGMQYMLEELRTTLDTIVEDFKQRIEKPNREGG